MKKSSNRIRPSPPRIEELEPRILYSADFAPEVVPTLGFAPVVAEHRVVDLPSDIQRENAPLADDDYEIIFLDEDEEKETAKDTAVLSERAAQFHHELVIVDTATPDYQQLIDDILAQSTKPDLIEVVLLDASANGVEQLSLGSELLYAEKQEAYWRELISIVRQQYNGSLIYAENYDNETFGTTSNVRWWDALDYISIDAYYDLIPEENTHPTLEDMLEAWKPIVARLESYSAEWNKPILIPEMGYRSAKGSIHHPWDFPRSNTIDLQEQANAYEAFYKSFAHKPWFAGVLWWSHSGFEPDTIENTSYSPINKPAEEIIRQYLN